MIAFTPDGPILGFTGATSAPTSVQAASSNSVGSQQYCITNTDATNDCCIGWGDSDAKAKAAAVVGASQNQYWVLRGSQVIVTAAPNAYFSGITGASTAIIKVQAGYGS